MNSGSLSRSVCVCQGRLGVCSQAIQRVTVLVLLLVGIGQKRFCAPSV